MQSTTRIASALALWIVSMAVFILSSPFHVRAVKAFSIQPNYLSARSHQFRVTSSLFSSASSDAQWMSASESTSIEENLNPYRQRRVLQERKRKWVEQSVHYYSTVMRNDARRAKGQLRPTDQSLEKHRKNFSMAKKLYFARNKVKSGNFNHAETIYRKLINGLIKELEDDEEEDCYHAQLAVSTLLLALLLQRTDKVKETRNVFINFFKILHRRENEDMECACSAKVLQAYALFEMKQGHTRKSYSLAKMAVKLDRDLEPVLKWKQFREAAAIFGDSS